MLPGSTRSHIVRQIRCETREAAIALIRLELTNLANGGPDGAPDQRAQQLLAEYDTNPDLISTFKPGLFSGARYAQVRNYFDIIYSTGIAYSFDLTMTEDNNLGATTDLVGPWLTKLTLAVKARSNRERSNERAFTVTDTLGLLLANLNTPEYGHRYCDGQIAQANYIYPIAGPIGHTGGYKDIHRVECLCQCRTVRRRRRRRVAIGRRRLASWRWFAERRFPVGRQERGRGRNGGYPY